MRRLVVLCLGLMLAGCATRYQEMGPTGGVTAAQITDDLWRITARGNLHTDAATIQDHVLLKAAETTIAAGRSHFVIVGKHDAGQGGSGGFYTRQAFGGSDGQFGYGLIAGQRREIGEDLMIRLLPTAGPATDRAEALDARQIVANVGRRVVRSE